MGDYFSYIKKFGGLMVNYNDLGERCRNMHDLMD